MFIGLRSDSVAVSHVWWRLPGGVFQLGAILQEQRKLVKSEETRRSDAQRAEVQGAKDRGGVRFLGMGGQLAPLPTN